MTMTDREEILLISKLLLESSEILSIQGALIVSVSARLADLEKVVAAYQDREFPNGDPQ